MIDATDDLLVECTLCGRLTRNLSSHLNDERACRPREHRYHDDRQHRYLLESSA